MDAHILHSINPATEEVVWEVNYTTSKDLNAAIFKASRLATDWSLLPVEKRIHFLKHFALISEKKQHALAKLISAETGKPLWEAKQEATAVYKKVGISIQSYKERCASRADYIDTVLKQTRHKPLGVVAVLGPYNFPAHIPNGHIVPALLAGNSVMFKPSELTPATGDFLVRLFHEAGIPDHVIQIVQGGGEIGAELAAHDDIRGVFFTGSSKVGQILSQQLSTKNKLLALEMGGNNALIVDKVNDVEAAVIHTIQSAFITAGQRCTCARRVIIVGEQKEFVQKLIEKSSSLVVGPNSTETEPYYGPVISEHAMKSLLETQKQLESSGAHVLLPMKIVGDKGYCLSPGILDITDSTMILDEEWFGPLLTIQHVPDLLTAIDVANQTRFGLSASVLSDDKQAYELCFAKLNVGILNWNLPTTGAASDAPFGGVGCSGNYRPSAYYAADYCSYPVASMSTEKLKSPESLPPGFKE